jgi:hypothetical protein
VNGVEIWVVRVCLCHLFFFFFIFCATSLGENLGVVGIGEGDGVLVGFSQLCPPPPPPPPNPNNGFHLNNIIYVLKTYKSLGSGHRLATDNNAFLQFHPIIFLLRYTQ